MSLWMQKNGELKDLFLKRNTLITGSKKEDRCLSEFVSRKKNYYKKGKKKYRKACGGNKRGTRTSVGGGLCLKKWVKNTRKTTFYVQ